MRLRRARSRGLQDRTQSLDRFFEVLRQRDLARLAHRRNAERHALRTLLRELPENRLEHPRIELVFGDRRARLSVALERVQSWLDRLDVQAAQPGQRFAERSQPLGGEELQRKRRGVHRQSECVKCILEGTQRQGTVLLGLETRFQANDAAGLVPEGHLAALLVFDQVRGENMALGSPRAKEHHQLVKTRIVRFGPEFAQRTKPRIAAGLDDEVRLAGPARDGQRRSQTARADRFLDVVAFRVRRAPRIVLVWVNLVDRELDLRLALQLAGVDKIARVVSRIAHQQRFRDSSPALIERSSRAHSERSAVDRPRARTPRRLGMSSQASSCMTVQALAITPERCGSCRCTGIRSVAASL